MPDSSGLFRANEKPWAVILAAGQGSRFAPAACGPAKQFLFWRGAPLYWHSARAMSRSCCVGGLVFVFPSAQRREEEERLRALYTGDDLGLPWLAVDGGATRQDSVACGLAALPPHTPWVLIHDAARPFLSPALVRRVCAKLAEGAAGVIPVLPITDTVKRVEQGRVAATLARDALAAAQTPQGFACAPLREAHARARAENLAATDDACLLENLGQTVCTVPGDAQNAKITRPEDISLLQDEVRQPQFRSGMGYDVHRFGLGKPMKLGGITIPGAPHVIAHSDGDVLLHALIDAVLGCACLGDIGQHFPDTDPRFCGISSAVLLDHALEMARDAGIAPCHADLTIVTQTPKIAPHREEIRKNIARLLGLPVSDVNVKATTEEGLGYTGRAEGIKAYAVVSAVRAAQPHPSS